MAVYALIALFLLGTGLAAYGAHVIFKQIHAQSLTVSDLDSRYSAANQDINSQLKTAQQAEQQLQTQVNHEQDLVLRQQDSIGRLQAALNVQGELLRQEKAARASEAAARTSEISILRARLRSMETRQQPLNRP